MSDIGAGIKLDGEKEFKAAVSGINKDLSVLSSEMRKVTAEFNGNANSISALTAKQSVYNAKTDEQKKKIEAISKALESAKQEYGENSDQVKNWQIKLNNAETELAKLNTEVKLNDQYLEEAKSSTDGTAKSIDEFGRQVKDTTKDVDKMGDELADSSEKGGLLGKIFAGGFLANVASNALRDVTQKLKQFATEAIAAADKAGTLAEITGLSAGRIQELTYAGISLDVSLDTMTGSFKKLINNMSSAREGTKIQKDAFEKLGISVVGANGELRDSNVVFGEVIDALGRMTNETERDAVAQDILGKSATDLNPLIKAGSGELNRLADEAQNTGAVMSDFAVNVLDAFGEKLEMVKLRAIALVGEGFAALIGGAPDATEKYSELTAELEKTKPLDDLLEKYDALTGIINDSTTSSADARIAQNELYDVKLELIAASEGVITATDLESDAFYNQLDSVRRMSDAQRKVLEMKLQSVIVENNLTASEYKRSAALAKQEAAQGKLLDVTTQLEIAIEQLNTTEYEGVSERREQEQLIEDLIKAQEKYTDEISASSQELLNLAEAEAATTNAIVTMSQAFGLSAEEIAAKTGYSLEQVQQILFDAAKAAETAGEELTSGFVRGMIADMKRVREAANSLANAAGEGIRVPLLIRSPSKLMEKYGEYIAEGLALGISDGTRQVEQATASMTRGAVPTTASLSTPSATRSSDLAARLDKILTAIEKGQTITIDGDALVGATAGKIDRTLGSIRALAARGAR